jgi:outer membrane lipoprotein carrier protein
LKWFLHSIQNLKRYWVNPINRGSIPKILSWSAFLFWAVFSSHSQESTSQDGKDALNQLLSNFNQLESFRANFTYNNSLAGTLSYQAPLQFHAKLSDGRVLSANGKTFWFFSPERQISAKQELKNSTGGLSGLLSGYDEVSISGKTLRLKSAKKYYDDVTVIMTEDSLPRVIRLKNSSKDTSTELVFSQIQTNLGLSRDLFNFQPPYNSQIVENPLNERE